MNRKPTTGKQTIEGVTKPSQLSGASAQHLVIQSRPIISANTSSDEPIGDGVAAQPPTAPLLSPLKHPSSPSTEQPAKDGSAAAKISVTKKEDATDAKTEPVDAAVSEKDEPTEPVAEGITTGSSQVAEPQVVEQETDAAAAPTVSQSQGGAPTAAGTAKQQKDIEAEADAVRRERELQEYIKNRQYFVPIDAVAHKRSVKVSIGLTFLVLLLGIVLLDLMLDSGMIYLVQKIPHTHFFSMTQ